MRIIRQALRVDVVECGNTRQRKISAAAGEFLEGPAPRLLPERQAYAGQDFVGLQNRAEAAGDELVCAHDAGPVRPDDCQRRVAGHRDTRLCGGRIGMSRAPADGAAITDLVMRAMGDSRREQWMRLSQAHIALDVAPGHQGANVDALSGNTDTFEIWQPS